MQFADVDGYFSILVSLCSATSARHCVLCLHPVTDYIVCFMSVHAFLCSLIHPSSFGLSHRSFSAALSSSPNTDSLACRVVYYRAFPEKFRVLPIPQRIFIPKGDCSKGIHCISVLADISNLSEPLNLQLS